MPDNHVVVKIDFSNALNCIRRDSVLAAVSASIPEIYRFCCLAYQNTSILQYGQRTIASEEGVQHGDPLGPLLFCLTVQPLLLSLASDLILGFLDDFTIGGHLTSVAADVATIRSSGASLGLSLNSIKSEVISCSGDVSHPQFIGFRQLSIDNATLLGAPIFAGQALNDSLSALYCDLEVAVERLQLISAHDALILLKSCLGGPQTTICLTYFTLLWPFDSNSI